MPLFAIFLLSFVFFYITWFYLDEKKRRKYSPPGPLSLPFIGSILELAGADSKPHMALVRLAEKYGDLMRIKLGNHEYVVLSSVEALGDLLSMEESTGRPDHGVLRDRAEIANTGIVLSSGDPWKARRLWMVRNLRESGIGRTSYFEETTREMLKEFHGKFHADLSDSGKVVLVDRKLALCAGTMMWRLLVGSQTPEDDADCEEFLFANDRWIENGSFGDGALLIAPALKYFIPRATGYTAQMEFVKVGRRIAQKWYNKLRPLKEETPVSFFHSYILEEKKNRPEFFEKDFNMSFNDVLTAAVETSNSFIQGLVLFLTLYPDAQENIYKEICQLFPKDHVFTMADLKTMSYTQAFMLETHRLLTVAPNWIPRTLLADVSYRGYTLKKGTTLLPNIPAAFKSEKHFAPDPHNFRPERFLDKTDPTKMNDLKKIVTPFSIGKRICPGESVAQILAFLTLVSTVNNFKLTPAPGKPLPKEEFFVGLTCKPYPFYCYATRRN